MEMLLFTTMPIATDENGRFVLSQKFLDGVNYYLREWPWDITVFAPHSFEKEHYMDELSFHSHEPPFKIHLSLEETPDLKATIEKADLVVASLEDPLLYLAPLCQSAKTPIVYISEYTYTTKKQIMYATTRSTLLRWRRLWWLKQLEPRIRTAVQQASGLQCNGTPTYEAYRDLNPHTLLYFDSRVTDSMLATKEDIDNRLSTLLTPRPLRLVFTGRLIEMKGVEQLIDLALILTKQGMPFTLDICGEGSLMEMLQKQVTRHQLKTVCLKGKLDFKTALIPYLKSSVDLFVCPHIQGDPSCTYLETMSCGVPFVGYDNEAFIGIVQHSHTGWLTPLNNPRALAEKILFLDKHRELIREASYASLQFAEKHTVEKIFKARTQYFLQRCTSNRE